jgi:hypothetical protein
MANRSEIIARLPLADAGARLPKSDLIKKDAELLQSLRDDVPVLKYLRASELATDYEVTERGLNLLVLLEESGQMPLGFPAEVVKRKTGTADPYLEDLADVRHQIGLVEGRILISSSGAASPLDGTVDTPQLSSTATVRRRVKRGLSSGGVFAPGLPDARQLILEPPSATLPQGPCISIIARVKSLETERAYLVAVRLVDAKESGLSFKFSAAKALQMARPGGFQRVEPGTKLQTAMDLHALIRLEVIAALDWASGAVVSFELAEFLD